MQDTRWSVCVCVWVVLPLYRDAVGVFYSPSRLGESLEVFSFGEYESNNIMFKYFSRCYSDISRKFGRNRAENYGAVCCLKRLRAGRCTQASFIWNDSQTDSISKPSGAWVHIAVDLWSFWIYDQQSHLASCQKT